MLRDRVARRRAVVFSVLVALCLVLLAVSRSGPVEDLRKGVNFAVAPIQEVLAEGARSIRALVTALGEIDRLRRENTDLAGRVAELEASLAQMAAVRDENERLSRLLQTRSALRNETVAAQVVTRQTNQFERVVTLDRGSEAGIEVGDAMLSEGGALAGTVVEVGQGYATARLVSDTRSLVVGIDTDSRATGEVVGRLSAPLAMSNIPVTDQVSLDDLIVTAGLNLGRDARSFYPRDLPIGRVVDVLTDPGAIVKTALLQPAADLEHLETVLVIIDYQAPRLPSADVVGAEEPVDDPGVDEGVFAEDLGATPGPEGVAEPTRRPRARRTPGPAEATDSP